MGGGGACSGCRHAHVSMRQTMGTLLNSVENRAYLCDVNLPAPNMTNLSQAWAIAMVCGVFDISHLHGEGVIVPMLFASMSDSAFRNALADCFSAWMSAAYASEAGSPLHTLVHGTGAFYFGITDDPQQRWMDHKAGKCGGHRNTGDWMMRGMVSLAAGLTEDKNGPWEFSCEGYSSFARRATISGEPSHQCPGG